MKVTKDTVVRLSVEMDGDSGGRELEYLHGGYGSLFPKLEAALAGLEAGGRANVTLSPADGFGEHDPSLIRREPRERLPQGVKVGSALHGGHAEEDGHRRVFRVTALSDTEATLDIPAQGLRKGALENVKREGASVRFELPSGLGRAVFTGTLEGDTLKGVLAQNGMTIAYVLRRLPPR